MERLGQRARRLERLNSDVTKGDLSDIAAVITSLGEQVVQLQPSLDTFVGALVATAAAAGVLRYGKSPIVIMVAPVPIAVLIAYFLQKSAELLTRAGTKCALEQAYNETCGHVVFPEEEYVSPHLHGKALLGRPGLLCIQSLILLLFCGVTVRSVFEAYKQVIGVQILYWLVFGIMMLAVCFAFTEQRGTYGTAYMATVDGLTGLHKALPSPLLPPSRDAANVPKRLLYIAVLGTAVILFIFGIVLIARTGRGSGILQR